MTDGSFNLVLEDTLELV